MTFKTKTVVLGSLAAALLALFVLGEVFSPARLQRTASESRLLPSFAQEAARRVELTGAGKKTVMAAGNAGWAVAESGAQYPAAKSKIDFLLQELSSLKRGMLVTRNAGSASELGFGSEEGVDLTVFGTGDAVLCRLSAGKTDSGGRGRYIRIGDSPEIYATGESLSPYLSADPGFWKNRKVFGDDVKAADISAVKLKGSLTLSGGKEKRSLDYGLARSVDIEGVETWSVAGQAGAAVDPQKVKNALEALTAFEGNDISLAGAGVKVSPASSCTVTIALADSRTFTLLISDRQEGDQYVCRLSNGQYSYTVPEWRISQALVTRESLIPQIR